MTATPLPPQLERVASSHQLGSLRQRFRRRPTAGLTAIALILVALAVLLAFSVAAQPATRLSGTAVAIWVLGAAAAGLWTWMAVRRLGGGVYVFDHGMALKVGRKVKWVHRWEEVRDVTGDVTQYRWAPFGIKAFEMPFGKNTEFTVTLRTGEKVPFLPKWYGPSLDEAVVGYKQLADVIHRNTLAAAVSSPPSVTPR